MKTMPYVRKLLRLFWLLLLPLMIYLIVVDLVFVFWELFIYEVGEEQKLFLTAIAAALAFVPLGLWYWSGRRSRSQKRRWHPCLVICGIVAGAGACLFFNGILHWLPLPAEGYYEVKRVLYRPSLWIQFISMGLVIPVAEELDLKKAARAAGDKKVEMIPMKDLLAVTGYIRGGCSPVGMKKRFPTYIDETAELFDEIAVSAGMRGVQVLVSPQALGLYVGAEFCELV